MEMDFTIWENLINNISDGVFILDRSGDVLYCNNVIVQFMGRSISEMISMNTFDLVQKGLMDVHVLARVLQTKRPVTACQRYVRKDGIITPYMLVTQSPVLDEVGEVRYSVGILHDMENLYRTYLAALPSNGQNESWAQISGPIRRTSSFIYQSRKMELLLEAVNQVLDSDAAILLYGESGVGKEVVAQYIHSTSNRKKREFVAINCAALPENLLEAELFGYEKGAFTGAQSGGKQGLIELSDGGTLFLDEIDSIPMPLQGKLLRLLETKEVRRLGGVETKKVNFRLLTATNADLTAAVEQKCFRLDLYYRISVLPFMIPPLRERKEDIQPLCEHFLKINCIKYGRKKTFSDKLYQKFFAYDWPGNVRELKNLIERIVLITDVKTLEIDDSPYEFLSNTAALGSVTILSRNDNGVDDIDLIPPYNETLSIRDNVAAYERWLVRKSVKKHGSLSKAAESLGSSKATLSRKLRT